MSSTLKRRSEIVLKERVETFERALKRLEEALFSAELRVTLS